MGISREQLIQFWQIRQQGSSQEGENRQPRNCVEAVQRNLQAVEADKAPTAYI